METEKQKMMKENNHKQQERINQQRKKNREKSDIELEAELKTQEFKEMLKRLK